MYSKKTPYFQIPYISDGEILSQASEQNAFQIIENQLRAAMLAEGETRIFLEGSYTIRKIQNDETVYDVNLQGRPSVRGICQMRFIETNAMLTWGRLKKNQKYWLYLEPGKQIHVDPSLVKPVASPIPLERASLLLMATVEQGEIDELPPGKLWAQNFYQLLNGYDPFSEGLKQRCVTVTEFLRCHLYNNQSLEVSRPGESVKPLLHLKGQSTSIKSDSVLSLADAEMPGGISLKQLAFPRAPKVVQLESTGIIKPDPQEGSVWNVSTSFPHLELFPPDQGLDGEIVTVRLKPAAKCLLVLNEEILMPKSMLRHQNVEPPEMIILQLQYHQEFQAWFGLTLNVY